MIGINIELPSNMFRDQIKRVESQRVRVGVGVVPLHGAKRYAAKPLRGQYAGFGQGESRQRSKIAGRNKDLSQVQLAAILDHKYGFFTRPIENYSNVNIRLVAEEMAKLFDPTYELSFQEQRRIENAAIAYIREPVLAGAYGSNSIETAKNKGFNWLGVDTGETMKSIEAVYERASNV